MHRGAQTAIEDVVRAHTGKNELIAIAARNIEAKPGPALTRASRWCDEPAVDQIALVSGRGKRIDDIAADLVAASPDAWSDGDNQVFDACAELTPHRINRRGRDSRGRSSPAGMNRGN